jgi:uncharacterized membrane protein YfcA
MFSIGFHSELLVRRELELQERFGMKKKLGFLIGIGSGILGSLGSTQGGEFRLPLLISGPHYRPLAALQFNLLVSLIASILICSVTQSGFFNHAILVAKWRIYVNVLPGSITGAFLGACLISKSREPKTWAIRALIFSALFMITYRWLVVQRLHYHSGFLRSVITIDGAFLGGMLTSALGTGSEGIYLVTLAIFHDFNTPMGEVIASSAMIPTVITALATFWSRGLWFVPPSSLGLIAATGLGSAMGVLLLTKLFSASTSDENLHAGVGLLLIYLATRLKKQRDD